MSADYDAIVLGIGGVGSATLYQLAARGVRCLGIDRFRPPHDRGSSHGQTRVIRKAYFEHPDYVPLLEESFRLWRELELHAGRELLHEVGVVEIGRADGEVVPGVVRAAQEHRLAIEHLSATQIQQRWPGLHVPDELIGVFEPHAGYLLVEQCVAAHIEVAQALGASLLLDTEVLDWSADANGVCVRTSEGEVAGRQLIITAGAWAASLLGGLGIRFTVRRKPSFWFAASSPQYDAAAGFPVYLFELPMGVYYGFPRLDGRSMKVAEHSGGQLVDDPLQVDRIVDAGEQTRHAAFLAAHLPLVSQKVVDHTVCLYTMSPDEHFIIDRHPDHPRVVFAAGLSGHGFKFTSVLGRVMADLAIDGTTALPIDFLSLGRFKD